MPPGQQFVSNAGQGVDVVSRVRFAVLKHLRACIRRREAAKAARIENGDIGVLLRFPEDARDPEVNDFHLPFIRQEYVGRLEVAVDEATLVRVRQGLGDAADDG